MIRDFLDVVDCIAHCNAVAACFHHFNVVIVISEAGTVFFVHMQQFQQSGNSGSFVDAERRYIKTVL